MTVTIERVADDEYVLYDGGDDEITRYDQPAMAHPDGWVDDAIAAGESISGPYDWEYIDNRNNSY